MQIDLLTSIRGSESPTRGELVVLLDHRAWGGPV